MFHSVQNCRHLPPQSCPILKGKYHVFLPNEHGAWCVWLVPVRICETSEPHWDLQRVYLGLVVSQRCSQEVA